MIYYGRFTYSELMSMPISDRHRYYFLLVKYTERDHAVSKGQPALPIDVSEEERSIEPNKLVSIEDTIKRVVKNLGKTKKSKKDIDKEEDALPSPIKDALEKLRIDGLVDERGALQPVEKIIEVTPELMPSTKKIEMPDTLKELLKNTQKI
jgi:hypothetical protein